MILITVIVLSLGWIAWEMSRAPFMDEDGNYTDKDGNIL